jgi:hypothetical protein
MASETQFTREDWRPSRKRATRPRKHAWGGQKRAPLAFLAAGALHGFGKGTQKRCKVDGCKRFAFKHCGLCRFHLGSRYEARQRPFVFKLGRQGRARREAPAGFQCAP